MPNIQAYHPSFRVSGTNESIKVGLDDWYGNEEILKKLGKVYGAETIAELVRKIKAGLIPKQAVSEGLLACEVGEPEGTCSLEVKPDTSIV